MQMDMHFYLIYFLARLLGFCDKDARKIAYASNHVDFAECNNLIYAAKIYINMVGTSHRPLDFKKLSESKNRFRPWIPFHFLPSIKNLICEMNGALVQPMLEYVFLHKNEPYFLHLVGVVLHVLCDSYSHWGFIGQNDERNRIDNGSLKIVNHNTSILGRLVDELKTFKEKLQGTIAEKMPVGHSAIGMWADIPSIIISYKAENSEIEIIRDNPKNFLEASHRVYNFLLRVRKESPQYGLTNPDQSWDDVSAEIEKLISDKCSLGERLSKWQKLINSGKYFPATSRDKHLLYVAESWRQDELIKQLNAGKDPNSCHPLLFNRAARIHEMFVEKQLNECGLIISAA
ncbi:MAG: hypothetical protein PHZ04_05115 [Patescibacteria group bacterium]|nr:hypothetical protein [Patescibacteria group bacterium]